MVNALSAAPSRPTSHRIEVEVDPKTGNSIKRTCAASGKLDSVNGEPSEVIVRRDGSVKQQNWHRDGRPHRDGDEPASVDFTPDGAEKARRWFTNGKSGRLSDGLAKRETPNGKVSVEVWVGAEPGTKKKVHYMQGKVDAVQYFKGKGLHRLDGPALISSPGLGGKEYWYVEGVFKKEHEVAGYNLGIALDNAPAMEYLGESDWQHMTADDDQFALIMTLFPNS